MGAADQITASGVGKIGLSLREHSSRSADCPIGVSAVIWDVTEIKITAPSTLWVRFADGTEGSVKFLPSAFRGVFSHLRDNRYFQEANLVDGVVTWPGEIDLAPDAMHRAIQESGQWVLS